MNKYEKYIKEKRNFRKNDCVEWTYKHHLNSRSITYITKRGKFIREVVSKIDEGFCHRSEINYCLVHFEGNKNPSKVLLKEIIKC